MLNWIKGSKSEHPFADDKGARGVIAELPVLDPHKTIEELCYWLDTLSAAEGLKLPRVLEIIDLIDQTAKNHQRKLSVDYLSGSSRQQKVNEVRIWNSVFSFWKQLADSYQMCVARVAEGASGAAALKNQLPMISARAMRALILQLKWQLIRYGPVELRVWAQMGKLYTFAEEKGFVTAPVVVYPGKFGESTIQREFLKGVMLGISSTDSLLPEKLEVAERIVAQFSEYFAMTPQLAKGSHYYMDLGENKAPARVMSRLAATPGLRFFGPGGATRELEKLIGLVQADGVVPSYVNLGGNYDPEFVLESLRHLARYWAPTPPARNEQRRNSVSRINVMHGFDEIVSTISGETRDLTFDGSIEVWTVENESEGGYGALMPQAKSDWLRVGTLLGVKLEDGASWGVGIVRRMSAFDHRQRYVGIQVLTKGASVVKLVPVSAVGKQESVNALLLPSNADDTNGAAEMNFLLKPGIFSPQKSMEMRAYERSYLLVPRRLLEGGHDFDMARFRVMQRAV
ncbi:MAG TPA: hypothetical protein VHB46_17035 [Burkholderiales bacterium]|nr:hypothetical protein [Burkholderiales bacterium]